MTDDQLVFVFNQIIRTIIEYASLVFLNPGSSLDAKILMLCKRTFRVIHGKDVRSCKKCDMFTFVERKKVLLMRIFYTAMYDTTDTIHNLIPNISNRSSRIILPHVATERRANGFGFACSILRNKSR